MLSNLVRHHPLLRALWLAAKVDAVAQEELRQQFQIGAFPKILAFKNGRMRGRSWWSLW